MKYFWYERMPSGRWVAMLSAISPSVKEMGGRTRKLSPVHELSEMVVAGETLASLQIKFPPPDDAPEAVQVSPVIAPSSGTKAMVVFDEPIHGEIEIALSGLTVDDLNLSLPRRDDETTKSWIKRIAPAGTQVYQTNEAPSAFETVN